MMFDWFKRLFGEGKIRFEFTDDTGKEYVGKAPYIGDIDTLVEKEFKEEMSRQWFVRTGHKIDKIKITGWY